MPLASLLLLNIDVQMNLMMGDILHLLDVKWSWISPSEDEENVFRPHGDRQMIRFGAHLVLVLRCLLVEQMKDAFREKIMTVGDLILHITYHFLLEMIRKAVLKKLRGFCQDLGKSNLQNMINHLMLLSNIGCRVFKRLCNILFREFALISMWRVPAMPIGGHTLLSFLAEPLKQPTETLLSTEDHDVSENLREFQDWSAYYSCDATYRNWLKVELENVEVSYLELSVEEKQRAIAAAKETLNSSFSLLFRKENPWLVPAEDHVYESVEPLFLELHAIAMLCLPSGECMCPDATLCATLMSALCSSVNEEVVLNRQLMVSVSLSSTDNYCIEVVLRCLATDGDGLGPHELNDGGILATVIAAGFKGELVRFQADVTMEISRLDAWYSSKDGSLEGPATYIVWGLCRRCCIPEVILRCMQVSVSLMELGNPPKSHDELIELVASPKTGFSIYLVSNNCR
ncbi:Nuclear pore complex protein NUP107 [Camellia lanceoleosa]|uniref:Nuclear pore complex protein NUP107 n=1 Tax=Camellia lanceoleosa TaxID=1840588 RepID=A0ACC0IQJ9_9ERIC|nr:Nuclear pore complex protein NUP107 [Camellia lanceoleosa]